MSLDLSERTALARFVEEFGSLKTALEAFCNEQVLKYSADCSRYMASVPRDHERASDMAARADAYRTWFAELKWFAEKNRP